VEGSQLWDQLFILDLEPNDNFHNTELKDERKISIWSIPWSCSPDFSALLTYLLTELSPSWGAANCAAPQELPSILWNPKVQYRVHKSPPLVPILGYVNPIHSIPSYLSKIHFNIVHPPTSWSSQWSLSFWLSRQYPICISFSALSLVKTDLGSTV
jgi:hypothetical protein